MAMGNDELFLCPRCGNIQESYGGCMKCGAGVHRAATAGSGEEKEYVGETEQDSRDPYETEREQEEQDRERRERAGPTPEAGPGSGHLRPWNPAIPIAMPVFLLVFLSFLTLGVYQFFWFYRNWKILHYYNSENVNPIKRTLMFLIPFYGVFLVFDQMKRLSKMVSRSAGSAPAIPLCAAWLLAPASSIALGLHAAPGLLTMFAYLASVFALIPFQLSLNRYSSVLYHSQQIVWQKERLWAAASTVLGLAILVAGLGQLVMMSRDFRHFKATIAHIDTHIATTSAARTQLLGEYRKAIDQGKAFMDLSIASEDDKKFCADALHKRIAAMETRLQCTRRSEVDCARVQLITELLHDNSFFKQESGKSSRVALFSLMKEVLEPKEGLPADAMTECPSGAFPESKEPAVTETTDSQASPADFLLVKRTAECLGKYYAAHRKLTNDARSVFRHCKIQDDYFKTAIGEAFQRKGLLLKTQDKRYWIAVKGRNGTRKDEVPWVMCSGAVDGEYEIRVANTREGAAPGWGF